MTIAADINTLLSQAALTTLVGDHIYPVVAPSEVETDYVVWRRMGGDPLQTLAGPGIGPYYANVQIGCLSKTFDRASAIADAVYTLVGAGSATLKCSVRPAIDLFDEETELFHVVLEATLFHKRS